MQVTIATRDGKVVTDTPFNGSFQYAAKALNGEWRAAEGVWVFDPRDEDRVRQLCREVYGTDGSRNGQPPVTARLPLPGGHVDEIWHAGRQLARRRMRDSAVLLARGVVMVEGKFPASGGSKARPAIGYLEPGIVLEVRDIDFDSAEKMVSEVAGASIIAPVGSPADQIAKLEAELASLNAMRADVEDQLFRAREAEAGVKLNRYTYTIETCNRIGFSDGHATRHIGMDDTPESPRMYAIRIANEQDYVIGPDWRVRVFDRFDDARDDDQVLATAGPDDLHGGADEE